MTTIQTIALVGLMIVSTIWISNPGPAQTFALAGQFTVLVLSFASDD